MCLITPNYQKYISIHFTFQPWYHTYFDQNYTQKTTLFTGKKKPARKSSVRLQTQNPPINTCYLFVTDILLEGLGGKNQYSYYYNFCSVQFSRSLCPTLCDPMNHSTSGLPVCHQLQEFTQTHVHRVGNLPQCK